MTSAHGITRAIQERASLTEAQPIIGPEQAAADRAAFREMCKDPDYRELGYERRIKAGQRKQTREEARNRRAAARERDLRSRLETAMSLREQGIPDREIAKRVGMGRQSIVKHLGEPPRCKESAPLPAQVKAEKLAKARELYARGFNFSAIARHIGVSKQSVRTWDLA